MISAPRAAPLRFYNQDDYNTLGPADGPWIATTYSVRGLTAAEIKNILALPDLPNAAAIAQVAAGICILGGRGNPALGHFPARPPAVSMPGSWGAAGAPQYDLVDMLLQRVADVVMDTVRFNDFVFRYGGEKFLIALVEMPGIWDTLRITLGWAWTWLVVAELVAATLGLGYRIVVAQRFFQTNTIFGYILLLGLLGLVTDQVMKAAATHLFRYTTRGR